MMKNWLSTFVDTEGRSTAVCGMLLHGIALAAIAQVPGHSLVELGTFFGRSAIAIGAAAEIGGINLICFDNWSQVPGRPEDNRAVVEETMRQVGLSHCVEVRLMDSAEAGQKWINGKLAFIFVDANHSKESVVADYIAWWPHLAKGGYMVFHDRKAKGVAAALEIFEEEYDDAVFAGQTDEVNIYWKRP